MNTKKSGFTLIEVALAVLVVAIGVILAGYLMLRQQKQRERDMQTAAQEVVRVDA